MRICYEYLSYHIIINTFSHSPSTPEQEKKKGQESNGLI